MTELSLYSAINGAITYLLKYNIGVTVDSVRDYLQINNVNVFEDKDIEGVMNERGLLAVHQYMLED